MVLSARPDDGDSAASCLAFSRSKALSLAALGAVGKNWAKLALEGRVIVSEPKTVSSSPLPPSSNHHNSQAKDMMGTIHMFVGRIVGLVAMAMGSRVRTRDR